MGSVRHEVEKNIARLGHSMDKQRELAALTLGQLGAPEAIPALLKASIGWHTMGPQQAAARSLELLGGLSALCDAIVASRGWDQKSLLQFACFVQEREVLRGPLLDFLLQDEGCRQGDLVAEVLGPSEAEAGQALAHLEAFVKTLLGHWERREAYAPSKQQWLFWALCRFRHPVIEAQALAFVSDAEAAEGLREEAARALGRWEVSEAVEPLCAMLSERGRFLELIAADALVAIGDPVAAPALREAAEKGYSSNKDRLLEALAALDPAAACALYIRGYRDRYHEWIDRCSYARRLGKLYEAHAFPEALEALHEGLLDLQPDEEDHENHWYVRSETAGVLGSLAAPASLPFLDEAIFLDDVYGSLAEEAIRALGSFPREAAVPILRKALFRDIQNHSIPRHAALALRDFGASEEVAALLRRDDTDAVRRGAAALGVIGDRAMVPLLLELLEHEERGVVEAAVESLALLQAKEAVLPLQTLLEDPEAARRLPYKAFDMLGTWPQEDTSACLRRVFAQEGGAFRPWVAMALGKCKDREAAPLLLAELARVGNSWGKTYCIEALGAIGAPEAVAPLLRCLHETAGAAGQDIEARSVFKASTEALAALQAEEAIAPLTESIRDASGDIRLASFHALCAFDAPEAVAGICHAFSDPQGFLDREKGFVTLTRIASPQAHAFVLAFVGDPDKHTNERALAAFAIGEHPWPAGREALRGLLLDESQEHELRFACAAAMIRDPATCAEPTVQSTFFHALQSCPPTFFERYARLLDALKCFQPHLSAHIQTLQAQASQGATEEAVTAQDRLEELLVYTLEILEILKEHREVVTQHKTQSDRDREQKQQRLDAFDENITRWRATLDLQRHKVLERLQVDWEDALFVT